jgi:hypothetical protein
MTIYYRHADCSFWREPPPDAFTIIVNVDMPVIKEALRRGQLPRWEDGVLKIYTSENPPRDVLLHQLRQERDVLLKECDWTQVPDVELSETQKVAWREYRKALRRLPQDFPDGKNVVWPSRPE